MAFRIDFWLIGLSIYRLYLVETKTIYSLKHVLNKKCTVLSHDSKTGKCWEIRAGMTAIGRKTVGWNVVKWMANSVSNLWPSGRWVSRLTTSHFSGDFWHQVIDTRYSRCESASSRWNTTYVTVNCSHMNLRMEINFVARWIFKKLNKKRKCILILF